MLGASWAAPGCRAQEDACRYVHTSTELLHHLQPLPLLPKADEVQKDAQKLPKRGSAASPALEQPPIPANSEHEYLSQLREKSHLISHCIPFPRKAMLFFSFPSGNAMVGSLSNPQGPSRTDVLSADSSECTPQPTSTPGCTLIFALSGRQAPAGPIKRSGMRKGSTPNYPIFFD